MEKFLLTHEDVNLSELNFISNGIEIELLDMENGELIVKLLFKDILLFNYDNTSDFVFPFYIGLCVVKKIESMAHGEIFEVELCGWVTIKILCKELILRSPPHKPSATSS